MEQKGKKMNESKAHSGFDYEVFRQETIAKMPLSCCPPSTL